MKKVILALAVFAAALCGCSKDIPTNGPHTGPASEYPILFGYSDTRATADLSTLQAEGFRVHAYFTGFPVDTQGRYSTFVKDVTYKSAQNVWAYEGLEYWIPGVSYWFKAFYPATLPAGTLEVQNNSSAQHYTIKNFDIVNHQVDVMVASATATVPVGAAHPTNSSVVGLNFQHLLACIDIQMKSAISNVSITKITLQNADNIGSFTSVDGTWTASSFGDITIVPADGEILSSSSYKSVTNDGFLVIPGEAFGKTLVIETNINKTYRVELPDMTWAKGNIYTYTAEVKQSNIIFNEPKVDEWDSENATGSVIIK